MNIFKKFFCQCARPEGLFGRAMLQFMNLCHAPLNILWLSLINFRKDMKILDIGCGGGATIRRLIKYSPEGEVYGIDISEESVKKAKEVNGKLLGKQVFVETGTAEHLQFCDKTFDIVTAVETVYFWPNIENCFKEVKRVLKPNGQFVIILEIADNASRWQKLVNGMNVYTLSQLKAILEKAGFENIEMYQKKPACFAIVAV